MTSNEKAVLEPVVANEGASSDLAESTARVFKTHDQKLVFVTPNSMIARAAVPYVQSALARLTTYNRHNVVREVEFDHPIGNTFVVETTPDDRVVWAQRIGHSGWSRCVLDREPEPCNFITIVMKAYSGNKNHYRLNLVCVGRRRQKEFQELHSHREDKDFTLLVKLSRSYWANHAFIFQPKLIVPGSVMDYNPYAKNPLNCRA